MEHPSRYPIDTVIAARRTVKVLADEPFPTDADQSVVEDLIASAGWAPFHRPAHKAHQSPDGPNAIVPWRFYPLDASGCRALRQVRLDRGDTSKLPRMLAAADTLILATWLPDPGKAGHDGLFEPTLENMEHIAAASAAIQNLLLSATARGIANYWSSGGFLRTREAFDLLEIPPKQVLLGAIFLFPNDTRDAPTTASKLRDLRGQPDGWARWVDLKKHEGS